MSKGTGREKRMKGVQGDLSNVVGRIGTCPGRGDAHGEPAGLACLRDGTEHIMVGGAFPESEEKFRLIFEKSADPTLLFHGGVFIDCNEAALKAFRCAGKGRLIGLHPWDISPGRQPDGRLSLEKAQEVIDVALSRGTNRFEWVHRTFDGEEFWVEVSLTVVPIQGRQIIEVVFRDISERKRAEEALKRAEEKYRNIFDNAVEGFQQVTPDGRFLSANPFLARMYGYGSPEELMAEVTDVGTQVHVDPEARRRFGAILEEQGFIEGYETERYRKDGSRIWVSSNARVVRDSEGKVLYYEGTLQDITRRKKAEEALLTSQFQLSEAMDLARIVYWELDPETDTFVFNDHFYALYGTTAEGEGGYRMAREEYGKRFVHPDDMPLFRQAGEKRTLSGGREFFHEFEHRILLRDGEERHILVRMHVSRDDTGRITRYHGANQDVTERKQTEKALAESEERYRIAIEHSNDGVAIVKGDRHVYVNQRFLTMFGYDDPEEALGAQFFVMVHPDDHERVMEINRKRQEGKPVLSRYEFKGVRKDGTLIHVEVSATRIVYQGEPATLAYLRDVTERLRAEEMLRQSQKMEAIGTLSAGIAHDFNNILTAILGFAELGYEDAPISSKAKRHLGRVLNAAQRGKDLVTQILSFSRKGEEELRPVSLAPVVKESIKMLRASLPRTIKILEDITTEPTPALADSTQIQQIIMNLGTNAAHAMWKAGGMMTVGLSCVMVNPDETPEAGLTPGPYLRLSVSDTGMGMDTDTLERVFDPFFTTKKRGEGTGLGLWVVQAIVKNHKGAITVKSAQGKGSTFEVFLPRIQAHIPQAKEPPLSALKGHGHLLIVDDEADLVELEKEMVERLGYSATTVCESVAALALFRENPHGYDLVLTDQTMPDMTGIDLAGEILSVRPDVPIILITGYRDVVDTESAREAGVKAVVGKPMSRAEIGKTIKQLLPRDGR